MKSALAVKPDPPIVDVTAEYHAAAAAWRDINSKMRALRETIDKRRLAANFAACTEIPERSKHLARGIEDLVIASSRSPLRAASDIEGLEFDLAELQPAHVAAHDAYIVARGAMAAQIALTFRERHLAATQDIVAAVDALSLAIQAERNVRADFAAVSPEPHSCALPNIADDLGEMDLSRWDSQASIWARKMRNFGVVG